VQTFSSEDLVARNQIGLRVIQKPAQLLLAAVVQLTTLYIRRLFLMLINAEYMLSKGI